MVGGEEMQKATTAMAASTKTRCFMTGDKVSICGTDAVIKGDIRALARCCASDSLETIICHDQMDIVLPGCTADMHRRCRFGRRGSKKEKVNAMR